MSFETRAPSQATGGTMTIVRGGGGGGAAQEEYPINRLNSQLGGYKELNRLSFQSANIPQK